MKENKTETRINETPDIRWDGADDTWRGKLRGVWLVPCIKLKWWWKNITRTMPPNAPHEPRRE